MRSKIKFQNRQRLFTDFVRVTLATPVLAAFFSVAKADRPLITTPTAIQNLRRAMPMPLVTAMQKDLSGLEQEDSAVRDQIVKDAAEYVNLRKGRMTKADVFRWLGRCTGERKPGLENPFCTYELDRRLSAPVHVSSHLDTQAVAHLKASSNKRRPRENRALAAELVSGNLTSANGIDSSELNAALRTLEKNHQIDRVAADVLAQNECPASTLTAAVGYKLEERFPDAAVIETVQKLYKRAIDCGEDFAAGQSAFRLGLMKIWEHNCSEAGPLMRKVEENSAANQYHSRAIYWRFFCAGETGDKVARKAAQDELLREHPMSFQSLAANGEDDSRVSQIFNNRDPQVALRSLVRPDLNLSIRAAEALINVGAANLAAEFIDHNVHNFASVEPEVRIYLAVLLNRIGYSLAKFKILAELFQEVPSTLSRNSLRLFFPLSYYELVRAKKENLDPLLILSLIRQESAFNSEARSRAGARGLMQVMPQTARMIASLRSPARLLDPATNIGVGTKYFAKRLESYGGDVELTLAAYNAGFARVDEWKKRYPTDNRILFLDFIPFRETRDYVAAILRNYYWYVKLYLTPEELGAAVPSQLALRIDPQSRTQKFQSIIAARAGTARVASESSSIDGGASGSMRPLVR